MVHTGKADEFLKLEVLNTQNALGVHKNPQSGLTILWFTKDESLLRINDEEFIFNAHQIICFTDLHKVEVVNVNEVRLLSFNKSFYCIRDHDEQGSCNGSSFFSASHLPAITIPENQQEKFEILWKMFLMEMNAPDNIQTEMLQMVLKRLIVFCTRLFKAQQNIQNSSNQRLALLHEFNYLVEENFKTRHQVSDYAGMLSRSPKTLANIFQQHKQSSPLQIIQERLLLEAQKLLLYSDMTIKEIAYEIGYKDIQTFSRFFRGKIGVSPRDFRGHRMEREK